MRGLDLPKGQVGFFIREALGFSLAEIRQESAARLALLRASAGAAFLLLVSWLGFLEGRPDWRRMVAPLGVYTFAALLILAALWRHDGLRRVADASPFVDVLFAFTVQRLLLPLSPYPAGVAGWSLGLFVMVVVLSAHTLRPSLIYATAALAWSCEAILQRDAHVEGGAIIASGLVLGISALVATWAARRLVALAARLVAEELGRRTALARGEELQLANDRIVQVNARLEQQHVHLMHSQRDAETMTSVLVHDMKQPLASIQGLLELVGDELRRKPENRALVEDLAVAHSQGRRLLSMISDLLAIARLERGSLTAKKQRFELTQLLESVAALHAVRASNAAVAISVRAAPDCWATVDRELLERAVENLLVNALNFARAGDRVELFAERAGPLLRLAVRNSGPPVPLEVRPHLFEKFVTSGSAARHNAGLGLYFCRLVAEAHQGLIALVPDPDFSVAFEMNLPADSPTDTPPEVGRLG